MRSTLLGLTAATTAVTTAVATAFVVAVPGCASSSQTTPSQISPAAGSGSSTTSATSPVLDPITDEPVVGEGHAAYYGQYQVLFNSRTDAQQFASLPREKRAKLAAPQVLAAKKITNPTCPLTGETLTAAAAPVTYEGAVIGFASVADANQFKSLSKAKQAEVISKWKAS